MRIEDYGLIGDTYTAALVNRDASIDWLCFPRFDSGACFAALLGSEENGHWRIAPDETVVSQSRRYREGSLVLETDFRTENGVVRVTDCMPPRDDVPDLLRMVTGLEGRVRMRLQLVIRFDYGRVTPWVRCVDDHLEAIAGPNALSFWSDVKTHGEDFKTVAEFDVNKGESYNFELCWHQSHKPARPKVDIAKEIESADQWWREWSGRTQCHEEWTQEVRRSLITLKALTYAPTGGIIAAPTTSLPEWPGSVRNWDYRYCWLRDATFTLYALLLAGYREEACAWRDWLLRAIAGNPADLQIMYGPAGERRLDEYEVTWLGGFEASRPVRVGNAAHGQFQLDVYGEVIDSMHQARTAGIDPDEASWRMQLALLNFLETAWEKPDEGIWEVRGGRKHFTHSKLMAWVAFDRAVQAVEKFKMEGPVERWRNLRDAIRREILHKGFHNDKNAFTQEYGSNRMDASLLMIPLVGFLPPDDERVKGTVKAIEDELLIDGFVHRYRPEEAHQIDGLPPGEGTFLPCSFWLADYYAIAGRNEEARALFHRLLSIRNDLGLLSEEYDPGSGRLLGNFPQAFTHVGLVNTARNLVNHSGPARRRQ